MRNRVLAAALAALALSGAAAAADFADVDADSDGLLTLQEVQAVAPNVTEAEFKLYDGDANDRLDEEEFALWEAATGEEQPS